MKYRYLGNSGLAVSKVCLGASTFGQASWGCNEETAVQVLDAYVGNGGNFIDTADVYAETQSEQIIGRWMSSVQRDDIVLATKAFFPTSSGVNSRGLSRKHLINACDASLKRLKTDYIDLYQVHGPDPVTPMEETLSALDTLVFQGKVRYIGCCNYPAWQLVKAGSIAQQNGLGVFISAQYQYNLLKRDIETEVIPACEDCGVGVVCWSPLSGGMLTGKYRSLDMPPDNSRLADRSELSKNLYQEWMAKSREIVTAILDVAASSSVSASTVALSWLLRNRPVVAVITGARKPEQIEQNCQAASFELPLESWSSLELLSRMASTYPSRWINSTLKTWLENID